MTSLRKEDRLLAKAMGWKVSAGSWFDKDNHYKEEVLFFNPSISLDDAFYVFERLGLEYINWQYREGMWKCFIIHSEEGLTSYYAGECNEAPMAMCQALLDFVNREK